MPTRSNRLGGSERKIEILMGTKRDRDTMLMQLVKIPTWRTEILITYQWVDYFCMPFDSENKYISFVPPVY